MCVCVSVCFCVHTIMCVCVCLCVSSAVYLIHILFYFSISHIFLIILTFLNPYKSNKLNLILFFSYPSPISSLFFSFSTYSLFSLSISVSHSSLCLFFFFFLPLFVLSPCSFLSPTLQMIFP